MIELINNNLQQIKALCIKHKVKSLEIFGSALKEDNYDLPASDLDFLVEFKPLQPGEYADTYFGLLEALEDLFNRHVDLVMTGAIKNPYFLESINKNREVLYAA
jgi:predicted nucleotidyltransferase